MKDLHILIADDHDFTRLTERRVLLELGVTRITEARDGEEALRCARASRPDVVISDLNMPGMDGMTFVHHLAKENLAASVIIASGLTKHVLKAVEAVTVASGLRVLGAIEKPLSKEAIASFLYAHENPGVDPGDRALDLAAAERAIALRQFKAWFTPVLDVSSMLVVAAEAAPRWESGLDVRLGGDEVAAMLEPDAIAVVGRAVISTALASGGLWRQMGFRGRLLVPVDSAVTENQEFFTWLPAAIKKNGMTGTVSIILNAELFAQRPEQAAFVVARCAMDGVGVTMRVRNASDLEGFTTVAACEAVTCPDAWVDSQPAAMKVLRDFASRRGAVLGAHDVVDAPALQRLGAAGIRWAQGPAVGSLASSADTFETHLAGQ